MVTMGRVAVVGGSLGGLTAALLLRELGLDVTVSTKYIRYLDRQGRLVHAQGQPYRFSNWNTAYRSLLRCFGGERYLLGRECTDIQQGDSKVQVKQVGGDQVEV